MTTVVLLIALTLGLLGAPAISIAQEPATIPRLGVLSPASPGNLALDAFRQGLRDLGYVEGQNILLEYRYADEQLGVFCPNPRKGIFQG
jgi:putative ABC transport system substrate-binding protein